MPSRSVSPRFTELNRTSTKKPITSVTSLSTPSSMTQRALSPRGSAPTSLTERHLPLLKSNSPSFPIAPPSENLPLPLGLSSTSLSLTKNPVEKSRTNFSLWRSPRMTRPSRMAFLMGTGHIQHVPPWQTPFFECRPPTILPA